MPKEKYLGDGVYASFDGYQIWLAVNHHENQVVALEPKVVIELIKYAIEAKMINFATSEGVELKPAQL